MPVQQQEGLSLPYVAGILDGEGCIGFCWNRKALFPRVLITNTNYDLMEALQEQFGGDIKPLKRESGWKAGWYWRISWTKAVDFLSALQPWIRIKARQMETVFAWHACRPDKAHLGWDQDVLELLSRRMKWLNKRGPVQGLDPAEEEYLRAVA